MSCLSRNWGERTGRPNTIIMENRIREARPHVNRNEKLIFERSTPGKSGVDLPPLDVPPVSPEELLGPEFSRGEVEGFPEVSELEVIPTSRAFLPGITEWTRASIRWVPAP